jgi:hypothetical protein
MTDRSQTGVRMSQLSPPRLAQGDLLCRGSLWITLYAVRCRTRPSVIAISLDWLSRASGQRDWAPYWSERRTMPRNPLRASRYVSATLRTSHCESRPATAEKSSRILAVHPICGDAPETHRASPCVLRELLICTLGVALCKAACDRQPQDQTGQ